MVFIDFTTIQSKYYHQYINKIQCGNVFQLINQFPDNFLFSSITSPPYWLARDYNTPYQYFDENKNCSHSWIFFKVQGTTGGTKSQKVQIKCNENFQIVPESHQALCIRCGCWFGEFGREPYLLDYSFMFDNNVVIVKGYLSHLCDLMTLILQKTRIDGSLWVNLGDKYYDKKRITMQKEFLSIDKIEHFISKKEFQNKTLCGIPQNFMIEMRNRGFIIRNNIIWEKDNAFPSPVKNRFTLNFEDLFFIVKNNKPQYWVNEITLQTILKTPKGTQGLYNQDWKWVICEHCLSILEKNEKLIPTFLEHTEFNAKNFTFEILTELLPSFSSEELFPIKFTSLCKNKSCIDGKIKKTVWVGYNYYFEQQLEPLQSQYAKTTYSKNKSKLLKEVNSTYSARKYDAKNYVHGRNKRCIWRINTANSKEKHCASYSEELIKTPIKASIPLYFCTQCGLPRVPIYDYYYNKPLEIYKGVAIKDYSNALAQNPSESKRRILQSMRKIRFLKGYSHCICEKPYYEHGFGFDPFMGIGNTALSLLNLNRMYMGIDLNEEYVKISRKNIKKINTNTKLDLLVLK
ncbi:MAG: DNA methyltransferase [Acidithiobacillus sp.]|jgi:hypothetical protein|uniref:DNA methyltransferase n=1 Tax=Acidithiobacillus sp. TaxID=1872118 RepID=UPI00355E4D6B